MRNTPENEKGQSLVEFALVVPLLLLLVIGIAEFGRAWMARNVLTGAAREAVRAVVVTPYNETTARNRGLAILAAAKLIGGAITFDSTTETDGTVTRRATASYELPLVLVGFIPGLDTTTISLSSTTTMRQE
jgi:Flp pilus assembly protein TadG